MKLMIASDLHGSAFYCRQLLAAMEREQPDKLLLLGDILYHGPRNDLPREYQPKEVIPLLNGMKEEILCVRGNCDCDVDQMVLEFPILAEYCILDLGKRMVFATHGHVFHEKKLPMLKKGRYSATRPHPWCRPAGGGRDRHLVPEPGLPLHSQGGQQAHQLT